MYDENSRDKASRESPELEEGLIHVPTSVNGTSLERFYDSGLKIAFETTAPQLSNTEVERIARQLAIVRIAGSIPRRLGGEANDQELALDRKRSKRVAHALSQSLNAWTTSPYVYLNEEVIRREGAQLDWNLFAADHYIQVHDSLRQVATWAVRRGELRWGRSAVINLTNELAWIRYGLRD